MVPVAVALGSNVGDAVRNVASAQEFLGSLLQHARHSRMFWSAPMYVTDQDEFCNAVTLGETTLSPVELVRHFKMYEADAGRQARTVNGPREIDLDLLAYGRLAYAHAYADGRTVVVPHPRLGERRFVVEPWAELDPSWPIPGLGPVGQLIHSLTDPPLRSVPQP